MKLSKRQKEVITSMRAGNKMYKRVSYCSILCDCSTATFFFLLRNKIIKRGAALPESMGRGYEYELTKQGKIMTL